MKFFLGKSSQHTTVDRSRLWKDYYDFKKTVLHGFPANPTCIAYDKCHRLLAIGTKNGSIQIYGKPGVEFYFQFDNEIEIIKILFISKLGQLLCLCCDYSLHLLQIPTRSSHVGIVKLHCHFVDDNDTVITTLSLNSKEDLLFIGLKNGDIHLLDIGSFSLKNEIIKQEEILNLLEEGLKFKPGSVEAIEDHPKNEGKILIGYSRSLIVFWDYTNKNIENYFLIEQHLEHLSWNKNGQDFISCHNDGFYNIWSIKQEHHDCKNFNSKLQYGPFPCKPIKKIFWDTSLSNGEYIIFSGGMPRSSYGDKETVSIIHHSTEDSNNEKNVALDFNSKIIDFLVVSSDNDDNSLLKALVVLTLEEIVVIDLQHPDWFQFKLPYLVCLHSSPITCSYYCSDIQSNVYEKIIESTESENNVKYSCNEWPINGGFAESDLNEKTLHLLITGHEDGTIRFWDASTISLKHLYMVNTSKLFNLNEDDIALIDSDDNELYNDEDQNEWPPFRKVGHFDPYSDDPRLAIRKIFFCPEQGILVVGGTAGQLLIFEFKNKMTESSLNVTEVKITDEKDAFGWKSHNCLPNKKSNLKFSVGYQPTSFIQMYPPAAITALTISTNWQLISVGTVYGFCLFDYKKNISLIVKSTLKSNNLSAVIGGDVLISRRKSFKKSLRESFRRLRRSRSQKSKRIAINNKNQNQNKIPEYTRMTKYNDNIEPKPIERPIEATKNNDDMMSSMVRFLYFCSSPIISNQPCPTFWVGTNAGTVFIYVMTNDKNSSCSTPVWQLAKELQLKHKAPIIFIRLVDINGTPLFENYQPENEKSNSRILICSEEQFKLFNLPNFKTINKFKLTAHEGARVRRIDVGKFFNKSNENQYEYSLMCLTNLGDLNIFSSVDFKRKFQQHIIKKEDINGITSLLFTNSGEGFYLKSSSEYQRFSLSSKKIISPECFIQLQEIIKNSNENLNNTENEITNKKEELERIQTNSDEVQIGPDSSIINTITENIIQSVVNENSNEDTKIKNGVSISNPNGSACVKEK